MYAKTIIEPVGRTMRTRSLGALSAALIVGAALGTAACEQRPVLGEPFATPEDAAAALIEATERFDVPELREILGPEGDYAIASGDTVLDRLNAVAFAEEARINLQLERDSTGTVVTLLVGADDWPLPIPLVEDAGQWRFNAAAGREEILRRRVGRNELDAIALCLGYVEAQREYAQLKYDGAVVNQYAQRIISTPGTRDGLAWRAEDGTWEGPVSEGIAEAIEAGYTSRTQPFHGYYFKVLTGQGPAAPLGEIDYVVQGVMIGGFALAAAPAEYGVTGIMTFIVSQDGIVYQKDLGEETLEVFHAMERYNPDSTWTAVKSD